MEIHGINKCNNKLLRILKSLVKVKRNQFIVARDRIISRL